ncbi:class II myosin [Savitreella phatthalungensis]
MSATQDEAAFDGKDWYWVKHESKHDKNDKHHGLRYSKAWLLTTTEKDQLILRTSNGTEITTPRDEAHPVNPPRFDGVQDMSALTYLNEPSIAHNLNIRFDAGDIYTYSGLFLVAVNPYRSLPIYTSQMVKSISGGATGASKPHIFAIADQAYRNMLTTSSAQSILITGESGAGKTENTKRVIQYLTARASGTDSSLESRILQANPALESFGNAQTVRNDNSSRFGKYIRTFFSTDGAIAGARISWFLLEKSRVTQQAPDERNYHIFYQLLAGATPQMRDELMLLDGPADYNYLKSANRTIAGVSDKAGFKTLEDSLSVMDIDKTQQTAIFSVLSAVLLLGNIDILGDRNGQARFAHHEQVEKVCHLLGVDVVQFSNIVNSPRTQAGKEWIVQARTTAQAQAALGALARALYERNFGYLVDRINQSLTSDVSAESMSNIGVLDMAGFEIFERNSFEQLCINYTNEKLQQFFNHHMFVLEQDEYAREGIDWRFVDFGLDLQPTIDLIDKVHPHIGLLGCLDEECVMPKATDETFTEKMHALWKGKSDKYQPAKFPRDGFVITHYAAPVEYKTAGWLDKNRDPLSAQLSELLSQSAIPHIASLFTDAASSSTGKTGIFRTVAQKHKEQLTLLMSQLNDTEPHFVRCILPNARKSSKEFDFGLVLDQLRCNGVLEGIRIARSGYPNRVSYGDFRSRYAILATPLPKGRFVSGVDAAKHILGELDLGTTAGDDFYKLGVSKVFFRAGVLADLEARREARMHVLVSAIQARARGRLAREDCARRVRQKKAAAQLKIDLHRCLELQEDPWWQLLHRMKPLLSVTKADRDAKLQSREVVKLEAVVEERNAALAKANAGLRQLEASRQDTEEKLRAAEVTQADQQALLMRAKMQEASVTQQLDQARKMITQLERRCAAIETGKAEAEKNADKLKSQVAAKVELVATLTADKAAAAKRGKQLEADVEKGMKRHELATRAQTVAEDKLAAVKQELEKTKNDLKGERKTRVDADARIAELKCNIESMRALQASALAEKDLAITTTETDLGTLKKKIAEIEKQSAIHEQQKKEAHASLEVERHTSSGHLAKLGQVEIALADAKAKIVTLTKLETELHAAKATITSLQRLEAELESAKKALQTLKKSQVELEAARESTKALRADLTAERATSDSLRQQLEGNAKAAVLQTELEHAKAELTALRQQILKQDNTTTAEQFKARREVEKVQTEVRRLQVINADLVKQMARAQQELQQAAGSTQSVLSAAVERKLETQVSELKTRVATADKENEDLRAQLKSAHGKLGGALTHMMTQPKSMHKDSVEAAQLRLELETGKNDMERLQNDLLRAQGKLKTLQQLDDNLVASQVRELLDEKQRLASRLEDKEEQCQQALSAHAIAVKSETKLQHDLATSQEETERQRKLAEQAEKRRSDVQQQLRLAQKQLLALHESPRMSPTTEQNVDRLAIGNTASPVIHGNGRSRTNSMAQNFEFPAHHSPLPSPTRSPGRSPVRTQMSANAGDVFNGPREDHSLARRPQALPPTPTRRQDGSPTRSLGSPSRLDHSPARQVYPEQSTEVTLLTQENRKLQSMLEAAKAGKAYARPGTSPHSPRQPLPSSPSHARSKSSVAELDNLQRAAKREVEGLLSKLADDKIKLVEDVEYTHAQLRESEAALHQAAQRNKELEVALRRAQAHR